MVVAGNVKYRNGGDLPSQVPVFPLEGALLLPAGQMPLNIFEPRYLAMIEDAMRGDRHIGMIQPRFDGALEASGEPALCNVGCLGRITSFTETGDGRYLVTLGGIVRFRALSEVENDRAYRICRISPFLGDLDPAAGAERIDRDALLKAFKLYLDLHSLEADWSGVERASSEVLVTSFAMLGLHSGLEKQALLEAVDLRSRAEVLVAMAEMAAARSGGEAGGVVLQ